MAFTETQETILEQIIEAYQNGKRLSDLPEVSGKNPYNLYCEVLDEDGESKKAALASLLPYIEDDCSYGVEFDITVASPTCTRIGNTDLHKSLPVQSRMKGCLLDDDGNVVEYLDPTDWTGNVLDGSRGQVMVEIPAHYRKCETEGNKRRVRISELPLAGYHLVPRMYISAYQATVERSTLKLCSVKNTGVDYRGGNNNAEWDGLVKTLLGRPATSLSRTNFRKYARNRNAAATSEWNCMTYDAQKALYAFDKRLATTYTNEGTLSFEVVPGTKSYTLLMGQPTANGVSVTMLDKNGQKVGGAILSTPFEQLEVPENAAKIQLNGTVEIFEIIAK